LTVILFTEAFIIFLYAPISVSESSLPQFDFQFEFQSRRRFSETAAGLLTRQKIATIFKFEHPRLRFWKNIKILQDFWQK
jgi:hypothetical protein